MIDWGLAVKIAAGGFTMVFFLLTVLSVIIWGVSRIILRLANNKAKT